MKIAELKIMAKENNLDTTRIKLKADIVQLIWDNLDTDDKNSNQCIISSLAHNAQFSQRSG